MGSSEPRKVIIDTDPGVDDAQAILLCLQNPDLLEVLCITTCAGNTQLDNVTRNAHIILDVAGRLDIPVFQGSPTSLLHRPPKGQTFFGEDGFGDTFTSEEVKKMAANWPKLSEKHAAVAIVDILSEHKGEVDIICLGPLTNIALALRLNCKLSEWIRTCYVMGGNLKGEGNVTPLAEFNFHFDPEAAHIVVNTLREKLVISPWEVGVSYPMTWEWYFNDFLPHLAEAGGDEACVKQSTFLRRIEKKMFQTHFEDGTAESGYVLADQMLIAIVCRPELVVKYITPCSVNILLGSDDASSTGALGMMAVDKRHWKREESWPKVTMVEAVDSEKVAKFISDSFHRTCKHYTNK